MDKTIISSKQVIAIEREGIAYIDIGSKVKFINFEECYQDYLRKNLSPESIETVKRLNGMTDEEVERYILMSKEWKRIADRNVLGDDVLVNGVYEYGLPYVEFYTEPPVRIEFETQETLDELLYKVERKFHWRTFDLT